MSLVAAPAACERVQDNLCQWFPFQREAPLSHLCFLHCFQELPSPCLELIGCVVFSSMPTLFHDGFNAERTSRLLKFCPTECLFSKDPTCQVNEFSPQVRTDWLLLQSQGNIYLFNSPQHIKGLMFSIILYYFAFIKDQTSCMTLIPQHNTKLQSFLQWVRHICFANGSQPLFMSKWCLGGRAGEGFLQRILFLSSQSSSMPFFPLPPQQASCFQLNFPQPSFKLKCSPLCYSKDI